MEIIIVGGGIAGLSTYLFLRKHLPQPPNGSAPHSVRIYESHAAHSTPAEHLQSSSAFSTSTTVVGGGIGLGPNGMRCLRSISTELHDAVAAQGYPCVNFHFRGANGWSLNLTPTGDRALLGGEEEVCVATSRHGAWECLLSTVPKEAIVYRKVASVRKGEAGKRPSAVFEDGEEHEADCIIGADGVWSVVRKSLFPQEELKPKYTGLAGVGGFLSMPLPKQMTRDRAMVFTAGRTGFFGYSASAPAPPDPSQPGTVMWWSTYQTDDVPAKANLDVAAIKKQLQERHAGWKDPVIQDIIRDVDVEYVWPTWIVPELPHWGEGGLVLIGDAAHALTPTSGQGASQSIEDAQTLALLLSHYAPKASESADGPSVREAVETCAKALYDVRSKRVKEIVDRAEKMDVGKRNLSVVEEYFIYFFLWVMGKVPVVGKMLIGDVNKNLYGWSVEEKVREQIEKREVRANALPTASAET